MKQAQTWSNPGWKGLSVCLLAKQPTTFQLKGVFSYCQKHLYFCNERVSAKDSKQSVLPLVLVSLKRVSTINYKLWRKNYCCKIVQHPLISVGLKYQIKLKRNYYFSSSQTLPETLLIWLANIVASFFPLNPVTFWKGNYFQIIDRKWLRKYD